MQTRIKECVQSALKQTKPGKILDIPAGRGWLQEMLGSDWEYHGADLYTRPGTTNFSVADLNKPLPYQDASFDVVTSLEGLEHIENYHLALREFHRILRPGGHLLVSTPNPLNLKSRNRYLRRGTFNGFPHLVHMPADGEHVHVSPINLSFLIAFAGKYGLKLEQVHEVKIPWKMWRFWPQAVKIRMVNALRTMNKDQKTRDWMRMLNSNNVLLNDGIVVSFLKEV